MEAGPELHQVWSNEGFLGHFTNTGTLTHSAGTYLQPVE